MILTFQNFLQLEKMAEKQVQTECNLEQGYAITPGKDNIFFGTYFLLSQHRSI